MKLPLVALIVAFVVLITVANNRAERKCEKAGGVWHDRACWTAGEMVR